MLQIYIHMQLMNLFNTVVKGEGQIVHAHTMKAHGGV